MEQLYRLFYGCTHTDFSDVYVYVYGCTHKNSLKKSVNRSGLTVYSFNRRNRPLYASSNYHSTLLRYTHMKPRLSSFARERGESGGLPALLRKGDNSQKKDFLIFTGNINSL